MKAIQPKIIIINNCNDCPYAQYGGLSVICRKLKEIGKYDVPYDMDDCPLKPLPEKSNYLPKDDHVYSKAEITAYSYGITVGRNGVIDEITGEQE